MAKTKDIILSHNGHPLTIKEDTFISKYIELGNGSQAVKEAGYTQKALPQKANELLNKPYIADEIRYRQSLVQKATIASAEEIMEYFTSVMRGETADQFGLEAPLSERTKCAQELAKRQIDIPNRLAGEQVDNTVRITLDWARPTTESTVAVWANGTAVADDGADGADKQKLSNVEGVMPSDVVAMVHNIAKQAQTDTTLDTSQYTDDADM